MDKPALDRFDEMAEELLGGNSGYIEAKHIAAVLRQQHIELKAESAKLEKLLADLVNATPGTGYRYAYQNAVAALNEDKP